MKAIFEDKNGVERFVGYAIGDYSSSSDKEIVVDTTESKLNDLIPDGLEAEKWADVRRQYKLEDGQIVFDKEYTP